MTGDNNVCNKNKYIMHDCAIQDLITGIKFSYKQNIYVEHVPVFIIYFLIINKER